MEIDLTKILEAVLTLVVLLVTTFLIPYVKSKIAADKLEKIQKWVRIAVQAAEMIYKESGMGAEKKTYVLEFLNDHGYVVDDAALNNLIESAVLELKRSMGV